MYIIIVGAGKTGKYLISRAIGDKQEVVVIERDKEVAEWVGKQFDCMVINDDASSSSTLKDAGAEQADVLVATTNDDAVNLLIMMQGKDLEIGHLVSTVINDEHIPLFEELGIDTVENPFRITGQFLYQSIYRRGVKEFMELDNGAEIAEISVAEGSKAEGKSVAEVNDDILDSGDRIISVYDGEDILLAEPDRELKAGNILTVFLKKGIDPDILSAFNSEE